MAPAAAAQNSVSRAAVLQAIAFLPPVYSLSLVGGALPSPAITDLKRAHIIVQSGPAIHSCYGEQLPLAITPAGARIASRNGWNLTGAILDVPVGRLRLVSNAKTFAVDQRTRSVTVAVQFDGNANAQYLHRLGPATDWRFSSLPGLNLTLADVGRKKSVRVPLVRAATGGWLPTPGWHAHQMVCSSESALLGASQEQAVDRDAFFLAIAYQPPVYIVTMNSSAPRSDIAALERAGIVRRAGWVHSPCSGDVVLKLQITEKGESVAAKRGWDLFSDVIAIPVGRFILRSTALPHSDGPSTNVSAFVRFAPNTNAAFLKSLDRSARWPLRSLPGWVLKVSDAGRSKTINIPAVRNDDGEFIPLPGWPEERSQCA